MLKPRAVLAVTGLTTWLPLPCRTQSVAWASFGSDRDQLHLDGLTDTLPDFVGSINGGAELTIFLNGNHYPVLPSALATPKGMSEIAF